MSQLIRGGSGTQADKVITGAGGMAHTEGEARAVITAATEQPPSP